MLFLLQAYNFIVALTLKFISMSIHFVYVRVKYAYFYFSECVQSLKTNARILVSSKPMSAL